MDNRFPAFGFGRVDTDSSPVTPAGDLVTRTFTEQRFSTSECGTNTSSNSALPHSNKHNGHYEVV